MSIYGGRIEAEQEKNSKFIADAEEEAQWRQRYFMAFFLVIRTIRKWK